MSRALFVTCAVAALAVSCRAFMFELQPGGERCVHHEVRQDEPLTGAWELIDRTATPPTTPALPRFWITGPDGLLMYTVQEARSGRFNVKATIDGEVEICARDVDTYATNRMLLMRDLKVTFDSDERRDYKELAQKEQLQPLELELRLVEDQANNIKREMEYQRKREEELRNVNEVMNSRAAWLSVFSILVLVGSSAWQIVYLKMFFTKKKII
eukprot:m51a1_g2870 putative C-tail anchored protein, emp24/gp25L/p24 family/GOLD (213) ;mRNA; f:363766-364819